KEVFEDTTFPVKSITQENTGNTSALELTGDPLKIDLEGDESFGSYIKSDRPNHWVPEEARHFPLSLQKARQHINQQNKVKQDGNNTPIYVVCDSNDVQHTILLGAHKSNNFLMTVAVSTIGCYPKGHEKISFANMEIDHIKNTLTRNPKVDFLVKFKYYLYGTLLHNTEDIYRSESHGNIFVEVTCNNCSFDVPQNPSNMKMILKVITGHHLSSVNFLWEELCLIQTYLDILSDSDKCNDELTPISAAPTQESDVYKNINGILSYSVVKKEEKMEFDLRNIRQEQLLDKLWNILKCCENLLVLRDSLQYFFEELVETEYNIKVPENDTSNIATIINGLLNGKLAVPTLTFSQALECLFELGSEKLKNDYQVIIKNFYWASDQSINMMWSKFQNKHLMLQGGHRKTRISVNLRSGVIDLDHNISKLAYLGKLHVATEFIYLIKEQANLPEETFDNFCTRVYENYVHESTTPPHEFADLQQSPLCEFAMNLTSADTDVIQKLV
ncbi:hypothetical protein NQ318_014807, partial [Aromia moschata]